MRVKASKVAARPVPPPELLDGPSPKPLMRWCEQHGADKLDVLRLRGARRRERHAAADDVAEDNDGGPWPS